MAGRPGKAFPAGASLRPTRRNNWEIISGELPRWRRLVRYGLWCDVSFLGASPAHSLALFAKPRGVRLACVRKGRSCSCKYALSHHTSITCSDMELGVFVLDVARRRKLALYGIGLIQVQRVL